MLNHQISMLNRQISMLNRRISMPNCQINLNDNLSDLDTKSSNLNTGTKLYWFWGEFQLSKYYWNKIIIDELINKFWIWRNPCSEQYNFPITNVESTHHKNNPKSDSWNVSYCATKNVSNHSCHNIIIVFFDHLKNL